MYGQFLKGKKAVTFDMDGTLVDDHFLWQWVLREVCENLGFEYPNFSGFLGVSNEDKWVYILDREGASRAHSPKDLAEETNKKFLEAFPKAGIDVREGFWQFAHYLKVDKGMKLALVSSSPRKVVDTVLEHLGISKTFDFVIGGDEASKKKPDPEIYKKAIKALGVKPSEVLSFEDSPAGAKAAAAAGCDLIIVWNGDAPETDYPVDNFRFVGDFEGLVGNMDVSSKDWVKQKVKEIEAAKKSEGPPA